MGMFHYGSYEYIDLPSAIVYRIITAMIVSYLN